MKVRGEELVQGFEPSGHPSIFSTKARCCLLCVGSLARLLTAAGRAQDQQKTTDAYFTASASNSVPHTPSACL